MPQKIDLEGMRAAIGFLAGLGAEMNSQENDCQADPRFWVVAENKWEYGVADGYADGYSLCCAGGGGWDTPQEFVDHLIENGEMTEEEAAENIGALSDASFQDVLDCLGDADNYNIVGYREGRDTIAPNTMFLTKQEAKTHIERNSYHYVEPHTYAMTAWRSPQVEQLYKILQETDWAGLVAEITRLTSENEEMSNQFADIYAENQTLLTDIAALQEAVEVAQRARDEINRELCGARETLRMQTYHGWFSDCDTCKFGPPQGEEING